VKASHDKDHRFMEYEVGEWVWLRLHQRSAVTIDSVNAKL
jgi:hypothetical protein